MDANPLVLLVGGLALLALTLAVVLLGRRALDPASPYDAHPVERDLADVLTSLKHADVLYRAGFEVGSRAPRGLRAEALARALTRAGLGEARVARSARRVEWRVADGPARGAPGVDEPLCYFTLGLLRGATGEARIEEEVCHGTGGPACVFAMEVASPDAR